MADDRRYELEDLLVRPGTYFNPQTEVLVVVDDSNSMDAEIFNLCLLYTSPSPRDRS